MSLGVDTFTLFRSEVNSSLHISAIERFAVLPQSPMTIEREFSTGDPALVRAAVVGLLQGGRMQAPELHTENFSLLTRFVAIRARS